MLKLSAFDVFVGSLRSPATRKEYIRKLKNYTDFFEISDRDEYVKKDPNEIHDELVYYINSEKKKITKKSYNKR